MSRRRRAEEHDIPAPVTAWFRGELERAPWTVRAFPGWALLPDWWREWRGMHPRAGPPADAAWLADPTDPRHRIYTPALTSARQINRRP